MDTLQMLGSALGLGLAAGIRLYLTVLFVGMGIRFGFFSLNPALSSLEVLSHPAVMTVAGVAAAIEFLADKIPWIDSFWDTLHTFIRPVGAAILGATALGEFDPATKMIVALLCGGVAFSGHSSKAATRLMVNHSPEPVTNIGLSVLEDMLAPAGIWLALEYPLVSLSILVVFLVLFAWLSPKILRLLHVEFAAIAALFRRLSRGGPKYADKPTDGLSDLLTRMEPMPEEAFRKFASALKTNKPPLAIRCVATRSMRRLRNSIGYLCYMDSELVFVTKRLLRTRTHAVALDAITDSAYLGGLVMDELVLKTGGSEIRFDVFKLHYTATSPKPVERTA
jgi:hypothetical protein